MKYTERPAWMAPSRRRSAEPAQAVSLSLVSESSPRQVPVPHGGGYNPYDTVKTRTADIWRHKPKRS
jgi:hypothetical protein